MLSLAVLSHLIEKNKPDITIIFYTIYLGLELIAVLILKLRGVMQCSPIPPAGFPQWNRPGAD